VQGVDAYVNVANTCYASIASEGMALAPWMLAQSTADLAMSVYYLEVVGVNDKPRARAVLARAVLA